MINQLILKNFVGENFLIIQFYCYYSKIYFYMCFLGFYGYKLVKFGNYFGIRGIFFWIMFCIQFFGFCWDLRLIICVEVMRGSGDGVREGLVFLCKVFILGKVIVGFLDKGSLIFLERR